MASRARAPLSEGEVFGGVSLLLIGTTLLLIVWCAVRERCWGERRAPWVDPRRARVAVAAPVYRTGIPPTRMYPLRVGRGERFVMDTNRFI